jgi:hypothetical protein
VCRVKRAVEILNVRALDAWRASGRGTGPLADPFCGIAIGEGERGRPEEEQRRLRVKAMREGAHLWHASAVLV